MPASASFCRFARDARGASYVEYLVLVGVALALAAFFGAFGSTVKTRLESPKPAQHPEVMGL